MKKTPTEGSFTLLTCGIATLLQAWKNKLFGIGLPVILGTSFVAVTPMISIGTIYGLSAIYGSIIAAGLFIVIFAAVYGKLVSLFPPVVTGSVVIIIGLSLIPTGIRNMGGGANSPDFGSMPNIILSFGVLLIILILNRYLKGFMQSISVLIGIIIGTAVAACMGKINFTSVSQASWFHMPTPFYFGTPTFEVVPVLTMILVGTVILVESTGAFLALGKICSTDVTEKDITRGYRAEGLSFILGGILNAFPYSTFAQNVGLVQLTGVKKRNIVVAAGCILVGLGLIPKIAALATLIPSAVLGGATVVMFGMVVSSGIKILSEVDFSNNNNLLVIACSVSLGMGATVVPDLFKGLPEMLRIIMGDGIISGSITAILLNLLFSKRSSKQGKAMSDTKKLMA